MCQAACWGLGRYSGTEHTNPLGPAFSPELQTIK